MAVVLKTVLSSEDRDQAAARLAELSSLKYGETQILKTLTEEFSYNFTRKQLYTLKKRPVYIDIRKKFTESLVEESVSRLKTELAELVPLVAPNVRQNLESGNLQAVIVLAKILGVESEAPAQQAQSLQIIMPGSAPEKPVVEVTDASED